MPSPERTRFETRPADWLSVAEALRRILTRGSLLPVETVPLAEGLGRALARGVLAGATLPPWDNSAMDGYAVRHRDLSGASPSAPAVLRVVGEIRAGELAPPGVGEGEAVRIMTGAPVPSGADTIVRVEDTDAEAGSGEVRIFSPPPQGKDIRPRGQDMLEGEEVLPAGTGIGPGQIGLLAGAGANEIPVHRMPRVAILSSGDEIAGAGDYHRVSAGMAIPETNGPMLAAAVRAMAGTPLPLGIAPDTAEGILEGVAAARKAGADVLLTSGGASMGEHDLFKRVLDDEGFQLEFWRVRMRPGTPFSFGILPADQGASPLPVFGLPGNPASAFVTFQILCRPFLLSISGHRRIHRPVIKARASEAFRSPIGLTYFFRVRLQGDPALPIAAPTGSQTSGLVSSQGLAQGLAVVPDGVEEIAEGEEVRVVLLDDFGMGSHEAGYFPA